MADDGVPEKSMRQKEERQKARERREQTVFDVKELQEG